MQGVIGRIYAKEFGGKNLYSFQLQGDRTYYRLGERKPSAAVEGASVEFDVEPRGNNLIAKNLRSWVGGGVAEAPSARNVAAMATGPAFVGRGGRGDPKDDYWKKREERDVETQKRIEIQSCRNSAIAFMAMAVQAGAIKLPTKQADQEAVLFEAVQKYTKEFLAANTPEKPDVAAEVAEEIKALEDNEGEWN